MNTRELLEKLFELPPDDYAVRESFGHYINAELSGGNAPVYDPNTTDELLTPVFGELERMTDRIRRTDDYKLKNAMFGYCSELLNIIVKHYGSPRMLSSDRYRTIEILDALIRTESYIEEETGALCQKKNATRKDAENLVAGLRAETEEIRRGMFFSILVDRRPADMPAEAKAVLAEYIADEIGRLLSHEPDDDLYGFLEMAADAAKYFPSDAVTERLYELLRLERPHISYYAADSLFSMGKDVPAEVITLLADDLEYAALTHELLCRHGRKKLFPADKSDQVYLAKSDLAHWLVYPTELGCLPDEMEYLGKVRKKGLYHVFRYRSDSENLSEECRGVWLIGWSNLADGTFSNFDKYSDFEQETPEKTLRNIKRKLL